MTKAAITAALALAAALSTAALIAQTAAPIAARVKAKAAQEVLRPVRQPTGSPAYTTPRMASPGPRNTLPEDDCLRCATKALRGDFGVLESWQEKGYRRLLQNGARRRIAWVTHYWTGEPGVNSTTASGRRVERGRTAAMLEPRSGMPYGTFVLVSLPSGYELRQVWDTGSRRNKGRAQRKGADTWIDLFVTGRTSRTYVRPIWIEQRGDL